MIKISVVLLAAVCVISYGQSPDPITLERDGQDHATDTSPAPQTKPGTDSNVTEDSQPEAPVAQQIDLESAMQIERGFVAKATELPSGRSYPHVEQISLIHPEIIAITFINGHRIPGDTVPYTAQEGDVIETQEKKPFTRTLFRGGEPVGHIVGPQADQVRLLDSFVGGNPEAKSYFFEDMYQIQSEDDPDYASALSPVTTSIKSEPIDFVRYPGWKFDFISRTTLFLHLPEPLESGASYTIRSTGSLFDTKTFTFDSRQTRSEALHVSQAGFRPDDPVKFATLSGWLGTGGPLTYEGLDQFSLIDAITGEEVFQGEITFFKSKEEPDDPHPDRRVNFNLADTYRLDFSEFDTPGIYRIAVDGLGTSFPFPIHEDVWTRLFQVSAKGIFFHRASQPIDAAIGGDFLRPLNFHPDMGKVAKRTNHQTNPLLYKEAKNKNQAKAFTLLEEAATDEEVPQAWGGHFDAGDYDRRTPHLIVPLYYMELYRFNPEFFQGLTWNIPESGNDLPDILDEAKWGIDVWKRLQSPEGGIPSWIESSAHPRGGETSWRDSLPLYVTPPEAQASYHYAAAATRFANVVRPFDSAMADDYLRSAIRAFDFAEKELQQTAHPEKIRKPILAYRNLAAVELLNETRDTRYHDIFLEDTFFHREIAPLQIWKRESEGGVNRQDSAALAYCFLDLPVVNEQVRENARNALLRNADFGVEMAASTSNGFAKFDASSHIGWGRMGAPQPLSLIRALYLTGDSKYLSAAIRATQFMLGNNGDNMVFTTGVGSRHVENVLYGDSRKGNLPMPPGITVYGPWDNTRLTFWGIRTFKEHGLLIPEYEKWPVSESYYDMATMLAGHAEYTIQETMAQAGYFWGGIAAWDKSRASAPKK